MRLQRQHPDHFGPSSSMKISHNLIILHLFLFTICMFYLMHINFFFLSSHMLLKWSFRPVAGFLLVGFFACLTLLVQTLLVFEFVVSPTHDYTTFSDYGSDVCINYLLFAFLLLTSYRFVQRYSDHARPCKHDVVHVITYFV